MSQGESDDEPEEHRRWIVAKQRLSTLLLKCKAGGGAMGVTTLPKTTIPEPLAASTDHQQMERELSAAVLGLKRSVQMIRTVRSHGAALGQPQLDDVFQCVIDALRAMQSCIERCQQSGKDISSQSITDGTKSNAEASPQTLLPPSREQTEQPLTKSNASRGSAVSLSPQGTLLQSRAPIANPTVGARVPTAPPQLNFRGFKNKK